LKKDALKRLKLPVDIKSGVNFTELVDYMQSILFTKLYAEHTAH